MPSLLARETSVPQVAIQMGMPNGHVAQVVGIAPMVLRVEHQALGAGVLGGVERRLKINIEMLLGRRVAFPLHHAIGLEGRDDPGAFMPGAQLDEVGIAWFLLAATRSRQQHRRSGARSRNLQEGPAVRHETSILSCQSMIY